MVVIQLFGGFALNIDGADTQVRESVADVVALLALAQRPVRRVVVASRLWPDHDETSALGNLRTVLWRGKDVTGLLVADRLSVRLGPAVNVDLWERLAWIDRLRAGDTSDLGFWSRMNIHAELLPGNFTNDVIVERERVRYHTLATLDLVAAAYMAESRFAEAFDISVESMAVEPLRVSGYRYAIQCCLEMGEVHEAKRVLAMCDRLFRSSLSIAAPPELCRMLRTMDPDASLVG